MVLGLGYSNRISLETIKVWIIQKLVWGCRLKTRGSFKAIRGRAGVLSLLRRKGLNIDKGGVESWGKGRTGENVFRF